MYDNNLPLYELTINPEKDSFVDAIGIVDAPATDSDFFAFSKNKKLLFADEEQQELIGVAMTPDMKIYRRDEDGTEYNVFFSKQTIKQIAQIFFEKGLTQSFNINHNSNANAGAFVYQSFIVDSKLGIEAPKILGKQVDGTWILGVKVTDSNTWKSIKNKELNGFSVEGIFQVLETTIKNKHKKNKVNYNSKEERLLKELQNLNNQLSKL